MTSSQTGRLTCLQRTAWNVTSNPVAAIGLRELGHGHRRRTEKNIRRHLLSSNLPERTGCDLHTDQGPMTWRRVVFNLSDTNKAEVELVFGFFWLTYPDPTSTGRPRTYKHEFVYPTLTQLKECTGMAMATVGPVISRRSITYRKSMSTSLRRLFVTLTDAGCVTCTDLSSPTLVGETRRKLLGNEGHRTAASPHFSDLAWDEVNDRIIVLEKARGGDTRSLHILDIDELSLAITIKFMVPNLRIGVFENLICMTDRAKEVIDILDVYSLCSTHEEQQGGGVTISVSERPSSLARIPTIDGYLNILTPFWPPLYVSKSGNMGELGEDTFRVQDFRMETPILQVPCSTFEFMFIETVSDSSRDIFVRRFVEGSHKLYKMERIEYYEESQFNVSEHQPFENPLPTAANSSPSGEPAPTRRSPRVRRRATLKPSTVVYDVKFSREYGLFAAITQDGNTVKTSFYESMSYKHCSEINLPAIPLSSKDMEAVKSVECTWNLDSLTVQLIFYNGNEFACASLLETARICC